MGYFFEVLSDILKIDDIAQIVYDLQIAYYDNRITEYEKKMIKLEEEYQELKKRVYPNEIIDKCSGLPRTFVLAKEIHMYRNMIIFSRRNKNESFENFQKVDRDYKYN